MKKKLSTKTGDQWTKYRKHDQICYKRAITIVNLAEMLNQFKWKTGLCGQYKSGNKALESHKI